MSAGSADTSNCAARLTLDDFAEFFGQVNGDKPPFPWQKRLAERALAGMWPRVIDIPTGAGKTAVIDIAVFAMAARPEISPRRIVFVIDRRIVVNQVSRHAMKIRDAVTKGKTKELRTIRERLKHLSGGHEPLGVTALQGGIPIDGEWAQRPDQPWILVSTVDQFGSRLLFSGYGVSKSMRPVHAGLVGNDCLVVMDEVHLSAPFAETLAQVADTESGKPNRRFSVVEMSATPGNGDREKFGLDAKDREHHVLRPRIMAEKRARLVAVKDRDSMPAEVVKIVDSIYKNRGTNRINSVGVVVNFVRTARETHRALEKSGRSPYLITGRMRPLDRVSKMKEIDSIVNPDGERQSDKFTVVVATQAIEVGADISFEAMITECAAVDSLRQRFGRLDRRGAYSGRGNPAQAWIVCPTSVIKSKKPDPVYGESIKATWEELSRRCKDGPVDVGPLALTDFPSEAAARQSKAPLLLRSHVESLIQTNPKPDARPAIDRFLHGIDVDHTPDVSIVWRHDASRATLKHVPPRQAEYLQVPLYAVQAWLSSRTEDDVADVDQYTKPESKNTASQNDGAPIKVRRWNGIKAGADDIAVDEIEAGDVLVVDPSHGGLTDGTWDPASTESVSDLGDEAQLRHGRRVTLRLDKALLGDGFPDKLPAPDVKEEVDLPASERIKQWLSAVPEGAGGLDWMHEAIKRLGSNFEIITAGADDYPEYYVLAERHKDTKNPVVEYSTMDGSDESNSMIATGVTLRRHLDGVGERAGQIAMRLGLDDFAGDLRLAGRLHDIGKADPRFQSQLVGDDPVDREMQEEPLAKSLPGVRQVGRTYPAGMRHEIASVAMLESDSKVLDGARDRDLVLHLIGSHHGWGRPLLPAIPDPDPPAFSYSFDDHEIRSAGDIFGSSLALDMADRFWRLVERYGYYGLAWLEAIMRLADHQQSAEEAET